MNNQPNGNNQNGYYNNQPYGIAPNGYYNNQPYRNNQKGYYNQQNMGNTNYGYNNAQQVKSQPKKKIHPLTLILLIILAVIIGVIIVILISIELSTIHCVGDSVVTNDVKFTLDTAYRGTVMDYDENGMPITFYALFLHFEAENVGSENHYVDSKFFKSNIRTGTKILKDLSTDNLCGDISPGESVKGFVIYEIYKDFLSNDLYDLEMEYSSAMDNMKFYCKFHINDIEDVDAQQSEIGYEETDYDETYSNNTANDETNDYNVINSIGDSVVSNDIKFTLTELYKTGVIRGENYNTGASEGKIFLVLGFEVENVGYDTKYVSSAFDASLDGYMIDKSYKSNLHGFNGNISPNSKGKSYVVYEVPEDWNNLEMHHSRGSQDFYCRFAYNDIGY